MKNEFLYTLVFTNHHFNNPEYCYIELTPEFKTLLRNGRDMAKKCIQLGLPLQTIDLKDLSCIFFMELENKQKTQTLDALLNTSSSGAILGDQSVSPENLIPYGNKYDSYLKINSTTFFILAYDSRTAFEFWTATIDIDQIV